MVKSEEAATKTWLLRFFGRIFYNPYYEEGTKELFYRLYVVHGAMYNIIYHSN